ncbi:MAG: DUF1338 domain-containing protein [Halobacteriovoraceae bacterium]|nr:DUF1338 domain-containing protein [Halobacteriovoraceae bacterium]MCB9093600.1 DUF1338 domain-containing protein [Halobacteriovoraceae bacterium]
MNIQDLLNRMWEDYTSLNPEAKTIHDSFSAEGESVINDHVAFRTFDHPKVNVDVLAKEFLKNGYIEKGQYDFKEKKLFAKHFQHPDSKFPKVFISQLLTKEFSKDLQNIVNKLVEQISEKQISADDFCISGRPWNVDFNDYQTLKKESEYAAWLSAFGFRVNHFTVYVNHLKKYPTIQAVNNFVKSKGFQLNTSGGEIKGSPSVLLEQSSTLAYNQEIKFSDGTHTIPACYYEFALRYPDSKGNLYQGFVAQSADKIFESTDRGH